MSTSLLLGGNSAVKKQPMVGFRCFFFRLISLVLIITNIGSVFFLNSSMIRRYGCSAKNGAVVVGGCRRQSAVDFVCVGSKFGFLSYCCCCSSNANKMTMLFLQYRLQGNGVGDRCRRRQQPAHKLCDKLILQKTKNTRFPTSRSSLEDERIFSAGSV